MKLKYNSIIVHNHKELKIALTRENSLILYHDFAPNIIEEIKAKKNGNKLLPSDMLYEMKFKITKSCPCGGKDIYIDDDDTLRCSDCDCGVWKFEKYIEW